MIRYETLPEKEKQLIRNNNINSPTFESELRVFYIPIVNLERLRTDLENSLEVAWIERFGGSGLYENHKTFLMGTMEQFGNISYFIPRVDERGELVPTNIVELSLKPNNGDCFFGTNKNWRLMFDPEKFYELGEKHGKELAP